VLGIRNQGLNTLRYPAVLFDLDGTLIDSAQDIVASVRCALEAVDPARALPDAEDIVVQVGRPLEIILRELGYPDDPDTTRSFVEAYRKRYAEHFNDHTALYPGVEETLQFLRDAGAKLALVTTKHQTQADFTVKACGLEKYFDYIHGWLEGRQHKPHPEPVQTALARLGIAPAGAMMVGDSELDIESARAAGVATCAVSYGFRPVWLLREFKPDYLISRITDLVPIVVKQD
jgi:2-phosphoglycolate phosphatase